MNRRIKRLLSVLVLAALAFSHASLALAACGMERGELSRMLAADAADNCCVEMNSPNAEPVLPMSANGCLSHCTADLQASGAAAMIVRAPSAAPLLVVPQREPPAALHSSARERLPSGVPPRILLHAFLI